MGGYDANEFLRTEGADALRKAIDAAHARPSHEAQDAVAELKHAVHELKNISRGDRISFAPRIAARISRFVVRGLLDKPTVINALFGACEINNSEFLASIASAIETGVREHPPDRAAKRSPPMDGIAQNNARASQAPRAELNASGANGPSKAAQATKPQDTKPTWRDHIIAAQDLEPSPRSGM
jgi:hypothetical protein